MKKCVSCNIQFNTKDKYCPLCNNKLEGKYKDNIYPVNIRKNKSNLILKVILFISVVIAVISVFVEYHNFKKIEISLYIILILLTNICVIKYIFSSYKNIIKLFGRYGFIIDVLLLIWFYFTRAYVITNIIIPFVAIVELIFNFIVGIALRDSYFTRYSDLIVLNLLISILPCILVLLGLTTYNLVSWICFLISIIIISFLFIFFYRETRDTIYKKLNF